MGKIDLGQQIKKLRSKTGLSQKELAGMTGVTPSTISQFESNSIYPSVPVLLKIGQALGVEVGSFFQGKADKAHRVVFTGGGNPISFPELPKGSIEGYRLAPADFQAKAEPFLLEIPPGQKLSAHFFIHKGEEMGYLLSGELKVKIDHAVHRVKAGDVVYLTSDMPTQWENSGSETGRMLWIKIK